jgi:hypothetical protein
VEDCAASTPNGQAAATYKEIQQVAMAAQCHYNSRRFTLAIVLYFQYICRLHERVVLRMQSFNINEMANQAEIVERLTSKSAGLIKITRLDDPEDERTYYMWNKLEDCKAIFDDALGMMIYITLKKG